MFLIKICLIVFMILAFNYAGFYHIFFSIERGAYRETLATMSALFGAIAVFVFFALFGASDGSPISPQSLLQSSYSVAGEVKIQDGYIVILKSGDYYFSVKTEKSVKTDGNFPKFVMPKGSELVSTLLPPLEEPKNSVLPESE